MPRRISPRRLWRHRIVQGATKMSRPENPVLLKELLKGESTMKLRVSTQELGLLAIDARQLVDDYPFLFFTTIKLFLVWILIFCWMNLNFLLVDSNFVWQDLFLSLIWSNFPRFPDQTQSRYARRFQSTLQAVNYGGQIQSTVPLLGWFLGGGGCPLVWSQLWGNPHPPRIFLGCLKKQWGWDYYLPVMQHTRWHRLCHGVCPSLMWLSTTCGLWLFCFDTVPWGCCDFSPPDVT